MNRTVLVLAVTTSALALNGCVIVNPPPSTADRDSTGRPEPVQKALSPMLSPAGCSVEQKSAQQVFSAAKDGVAVVESGDGQGSAFVVEHRDGNTLLLTNSHVVEGYRSVQVKWSDGSSDTATVVTDAGGNSPATDLALLQVSGIRGVPLQIASGSPEVGRSVFVIGAPKGLEFSLSSGVVSQLRDGGEILQTDAAINSGNSGGPVLDDRSCVVGMATFILRDSQGLNFAVSSQLIQPFLSNRLTPASPADPRPELAKGASIATASCFFQSYKKPNGEEIGCSVSSRTNTNGHTVYDVAWSDGYRSSYVFWKGGTVEILSKGGTGALDTNRGNFLRRSEGVEVTSNEGSITILRDLNPQEN